MKNKGQTLIVILGILVIFMIFIPLLVSMVQHEAKWTVKQKKATAAFHAAEAGVGRALWKIKENTSNWATVTDGGSLAGYAGTTVYDLYAGSNTSKLSGQYKVSITNTANPGEVLIRSTGRDPGNSEVRGIEVVLAKNSINASMDVNSGISWKPNLVVHWGPVVTYTSIDQAPSQWYPRKFSKGQIAGRDTDPTSTNSDGKEYWAFEDLTTPPQVDIAYYKDLAKKSLVPATVGGTKKIKKATGSSAAVADPPGSGYFTSDNGSKIRFDGYDFRSSTSVIYCETGLDFDNSTFLDVQAAIAETDVDFNADNTVYVASVPVNASVEYVKQKEENPGYTYPGEGSATYSVPGCGMHGFLYCGGVLNNAGGGASMTGVIKVIGNVSVNTMTVYYDASVASSVRLTDSSFRQLSWREIKAAW
ncbi:MAG: hypothetical protein ACYC5N_05585 [Endomicrobiales bacterium]